MIVAIGLIFLSALNLAGAKPIPRNLLLHDRRAGAPQGYVLQGAASPQTSITLRLALKPNNRAGLEKALYDVSTPSSPQYGQHLSKEEVEEFMKPSAETTQAVDEWLTSCGLNASSRTPAGDWLSFQVDVQKANEILDANFSTFINKGTGEPAVRTLSYSLPTSLKGHVNLIHPTTAFPSPPPVSPIFSSPLQKSKRHTSESAAGISRSINATSFAVPTSCANVITPACLQSLYGIPAALATQTSNQLAVAGFSLQHANEVDLKTMLKQFRPDLDSSTTFSLQALDGGVNTQNDPGHEANLDIQYTIGVASGVPTTFISAGNDNTDGLGGFLDMVNFIIAQDALPQVLTTSYSFNEQDLPADLENALCDAYMQLGARGVSALFSSGDGGVGGDTKSKDCTEFIPTFPSTCPFVTSVGATTGISPETSASLSNGGFSNVFAAPDYQSASVSGYLSGLGNTNAGLFNRTGRGYPDVSAQGQGFQVIIGGSTQRISGTSCSTPVFASVIALLNDKLISNGKKPLGFLNPFLYSDGAAALNDITTGNNPGCNTNGFPAAAGWDPVTGLGTPNFAALMTAIGM